MLIFIGGMIFGAALLFAICACIAAAHADRIQDLTDEHTQNLGIGGGEVLQHGERK